MSLMIPKTLLILALSFTSAQLAFSQNAIDFPEVDEVVRVASNDNAVELAKLEARKTLPKILDNLETLPEGWSEVSFKLEFPVRDDRSEFMWVAFLGREGATFEGVLSNEPRYVEYAKFGDVVSFEQDQIADWQYAKDGKLFGHYTTRALLGEIPAEARVQLLAILSETPE